MKYVVNELLPPPTGLADLAVVAAVSPADALRLSRSGTYLNTTRQRAARFGAFAALAGGAGAGYRAAGRMDRYLHWRPKGREDMVIIPEAVPRPVPILPFVAEAVEEMLSHRKDDLPWLFLNENGSPLRFGANSFCCGLHNLGGQIGVSGTSMFRALIALFDDCFADEKNGLDEKDLEAVAAMTGALDLLDDFDPRRQKVSDTRAKRVLQRCHPLSGPLSSYDDAWIAAAPVILPPTPPMRRRAIPAVFTEDPIVASLAAHEWPSDQDLADDDGRRLAAAHFDHLDDLRRAGRIQRREILFLLRIDEIRYNHLMEARRVKAVSVAPVHLPRGGWQPVIPGLYRTWSESGSLKAFCFFLRREHGCMLWMSTIRQILVRSGDIQPRRGRPKKKKSRT